MQERVTAFSYTPQYTETSIPVVSKMWREFISGRFDAYGGGLGADGLVSGKMEEDMAQQALAFQSSFYGLQKTVCCAV
jgi:hypothetical protein